MPAFVLVLCSGWRTTTLLARTRETKGVEKRLAVLKQLGELVVDLPFVLMGLLVLLTLWRAASLRTCNPMRLGCNPMCIGCNPVHAGCNSVHSGARLRSSLTRGSRGGTDKDGDGRSSGSCAW